MLKRSGGSLELRLNRSDMFNHNFMYVMLKCLPVRPRRLLYIPRPRLTPSVSRPSQDQDVQTRGQGKTEAFEVSTDARPSRGTTAPRDRGVETEATSRELRGDGDDGITAVVPR